MKLSVIIPVFNAEKYLAECLDSIVSEIDETVELVIVNDGSTDDSLHICEKYKMANIKVFSNENHGVSFSRNYGLERAAGEWVIFVDADDIMSKGWFRAVKKFFLSNYDFIVFSRNVSNEFSMNKSDLLEILFGVRKNYIYFSAPTSKIYRRSFLTRNQIVFEENVINGEDMLFNLECLIASKQYLFLSKNIYKLRVNINSSTKRFNPKIISSDRFFQEKLSQLLNDSSEFSVESKERAMEYCKKNAIITLAQKMAYSGMYSVFTKNVTVLNEYYFKNSKPIFIGYKKEILIFLLKIKCYYIVYLAFNLDRSRLKFKDDYYIDI